MKNNKKLLATCIVAAFLLMPILASAADITLLFPPGWKADNAKALAISEALTKTSGLTIRPRIAKTYPTILKEFDTDKPTLVYVGSFVQAVLHARGLSQPLLQGINGKEFYTSVLIAPKSAGSDPEAIVAAAGAAVAYTKGASSGESGAKAATKGKASIATNNHGASLNAVKAGTAKCAFVKIWWWEANKAKYPDMTMYEYPLVSFFPNPDNVLSANKAVTQEEVAKIKAAAKNHSELFGVKSFNDFNPYLLTPSLQLMKLGKMDPKTYAW